jgi:hypothetical protein
MLTALDIAAVFLVVYLCYKFYQKQRLQYPLPPGPKGIPILGNSLQIPSVHPWEKYLEWGRQYSACVYAQTRANSQVQKDSDVIHLTAPGYNIIVVNSLDVAVELFGKLALERSESRSYAIHR